MQTEFDTEQTARLSGRAAAFLASGRIAAAQPIIAALRQAAAPSAAIAALSAALAMQQGEHGAAADELNHAIERWPADPELWLQRAALKGQLNDPEAAAADAAEAVIADPGNPHAKALLGFSLIDLQQFETGALCLTESVSVEPTNVLFRIGLSSALTANGAIAEAREVLAEGTRLIPANPGCWRAAMLLAVQESDYEEVLRLGAQAAEAGVADALISGLAAHALSELGRHEEAARHYEDARKLGPHDTYVRYLTAASGGIAEPAAAPDDYVRAVFDGYASNFEAHLIELHYRVPGLVRAALLRHSRIADAGSLGPVLDLGCGTGFLAVALLDQAVGPWVGVDLSPRMLEQASGKGLYRELIEGDIVAYLRGTDRSFAAVLAADVFCYLGDLQPVLSATRSRLQPSGICVFSVEACSGETALPWKLGPRGRYQHQASYLAAIAERAGFDLLELAEEALRFEYGVAVPGYLVTLRAR